MIPRLGKQRIRFVLFGTAELIADAGHSHYIPGVSRVRLQLEPETAGKDMQIFRFLPILRAPHLVQEIGMGENLTGVKDEFLQ